MLANSDADFAAKIPNVRSYGPSVTRRQPLVNVPEHQVADTGFATQRKPMCVVAESCDCGERAAGR